MHVCLACNNTTTSTCVNVLYFACTINILSKALRACLDGIEIYLLDGGVFCQEEKWQREILIKHMELLVH